MPRAVRRSPTFRQDLAMALVLLLSFAYLLWLTRNRWFYLDEWSMITSRDFNQQPIGFSTPWDEHWVTLLYGYYQLMYHLVGLHSYLPYMAVGAGLHVGVVYCLWRIMLSCEVNRWIAVGLSALAAFFGAGFEMLLWSFQLVHWESSILLGLIALQLLSSAKTSLRRDLIAVICLVAGLMFSQLGLLMLCCCALAVFLSRGLKFALALSTMPAIAYAAWFLTKGASAVRQTWDPALTSIPSNVFRGITTSLAAGFGAAGFGLSDYKVYAVGTILLAVITFYLWKQQPALKSQAVPIALASAAIGFFVLTSLEHGYSHGAVVSRFLYVAWILCVPLLGLAITSLATNPLRQRAVLALTLLGSGIGATTLYQASSQYLLIDQQTRQYVTAGAVLTITKPNSVLLPDNQSIQYWLFPMVTEGSIKAFITDHALNYYVQPSAYIDQLVELQFQLSETQLPLFPNLPGQLGPGPGSLASAGGPCLLLESGHTAQMQLQQSGSVRLSSGRDVLVDVTWDNGKGSVLRPHGFLVPANTSVFLNSTITGGALTLSVSGDSAVVCES